MTIEHAVITLLVMGVIFQQVFFMWQIQKLVNKMMSKDFYSYTQAVNPPQQYTGGFSVQLPDEGPDRLKELNRSFQIPV